MENQKITLNNLFVDRTWRLYENKKGGGVLFAVKFLPDQPLEGGRANEVKVKFDGTTQELQVGEAVVRKAFDRIDIDPAGGNAMIDVQMVPFAK